MNIHEIIVDACKMALIISLIIIGLSFFITIISIIHEAIVRFVFMKKYRSRGAL